MSIMGVDKRTAEELSIAELEALISRKRLETRQSQLERFRQSGRIITLGPPEAVRCEPANSLDPNLLESPIIVAEASEARSARIRRGANRVLFFFEVAAGIAFVAILILGIGKLRLINRASLSAMTGPPAAPTPLIRAVVLPSGHTPPTSPGGSRFNEEEIPEHLRPIAQSYAAIAIPTAGVDQARSISIPALWDVPAPVVQGDGWEQLKKGVAQHVGTANPGEVGNVVLSAHNDIYGELFRDLDRLVPGDEIRIYTVNREFLYRVTGTQIVEPTEVSVMDPTSRPTLTLISCYPYLVDNLRIIVKAELTQG